MQRRGFLLGATGILAGTSCINALATDFSQVSERDKVIGSIQNRWSFSQEQQRELANESRQVLSNNVLPQHYKEDFWDLPRKLFLKDPVTNEQAVVTYFENGAINQQGYWQAIYFLRDKRERLVANHELKLLDLMCAVQAWMRVYGNNQPLIVTNGYRTLKTNNIIENAARNSMHMQGKAVDFVVPGMDPYTIGKIASQFQAGGVGIYLNKNFNHLDTSRVRTWIKYKK